MTLIRQSKVRNVGTQAMNRTSNYDAIMREKRRMEDGKNKKASKCGN